MWYGSPALGERNTVNLHGCRWSLWNIMVIFRNSGYSRSCLPWNPQKVPPYLQDIQPLPSQVWNYYDIGFDLNRSCCNMVCIYKLFMGDRIWSSQNCERLPLCCTVIICTHADEQCFSPPVLVNHITHYITT